VSLLFEVLLKYKGEEGVREEKPGMGDNTVERFNGQD